MVRDGTERLQAASPNRVITRVGASPLPKLTRGSARSLSETPRYPKAHTTGLTVPKYFIGGNFAYF